MGARLTRAEPAVTKRLAVCVAGTMSAAVVACAAWIGPWATILGQSYFSTDLGNHGLLVAAIADVGLAAFVFSMYRLRWWIAAVAVVSGAAGIAVTLYDRHVILHPTSHNQFAALANSLLLAFSAIHIGWGLYVALFASVGVAVAALVLLIGDSRAPTTKVSEDGSQPGVTPGAANVAITAAVFVALLLISVILGTSIGMSALLAVAAALISQAPARFPIGAAAHRQRHHQFLIWLVRHPLVFPAFSVAVGTATSILLLSHPTQIVLIFAVWVGFATVLWWTLRRASTQWRKDQRPQSGIRTLLRRL